MHSYSSSSDVSSSIAFVDRSSLVSLESSDSGRLLSSSSSEISSSIGFTETSSLMSLESSDVSLSLSSAIPDCDLFIVHPQGREGIGVAQPQSGTDYPLLAPSEDVRYLLADLHLEYSGDYRLPFHIVYLRGFGCIQNSEPPGVPPHAPIPLAEEHNADIVIVDDNDVIVFDSRDGGPTDFHERDWGPRNHIFEWYTTTGVCRAVVHTRWSPDGEPEPRQYPLRLAPESAVLDDRALLQLPGRVTTFQVVLDTLTKCNVDFAAGYNMEIVHQDTTSQLGGRVVHQIRFDATAGAGQGIFPDCTPPALTIQRINDIQPTRGGDFVLAAADCYFLRQPTKVVSGDATHPYIDTAPGDVGDMTLPDPLAGTTTDARGWPPSKEYAHLQFGNDCKPCCDCDDYITVAEYMNRTRDQYQAVGTQLMRTRSAYHRNRKRFINLANCLLRHPLRIFLQPQICPFLDVALQFANQSRDCLSDLSLAVNFVSLPGDAARIVPGYTQITGATRKPFRRKSLTEHYSMSGAWPTFSAYWDNVEPYASVSVRFRLEFPDCFTPYVVTGLLSGTLDGLPITVPVLGSLGSNNSSIGSEEAVATDTKTLNCPARPEDAQDLLRCYLEALSASSMGG